MIDVRAWLEILRISNAPTVVSNAIAGAALGTLALDASPTGVALENRWFVVLAPLLCYLGGMVLNDACDAPIDARERPSRPIPSGRIGRRTAFAVAGLLLVAGVALAAVFGSIQAAVATAILATLVVVYNAIHTLAAISIVLLAACRALSALIPMLTFGDDLAALATRGSLIHPTLLAGWTLMLSFLARGEVDASTSPRSACASCSHLALPSGHACAECGRKPSRAASNDSQLLQRLGRSVMQIALVIGVVIACVQFLPKAPPTIDSSNDQTGPIAAGLTGFLFATIFVRDASRHARRQISTPRYVGMLIAMLALIDTVALASVAQPLGFACAGCFAATVLLQRRIAGS